MRIFGILASLLLIVLTLLEGFETILQPRRVTRRFRYARLFYRATWALWRAVGVRLRAGKRREAFLSFYGPLSLLGLLISWLLLLIFGFALLDWSLALPLNNAGAQPELGTYLYFSGTTFFTLGYGDLTPTSAPGRALAVIESGLGFGFLAIIISYLPVLFQAFSRREVTISLMDARAGSPPTAGELLLRLLRANRLDKADEFLAQWERWAAELLESHLSFPVLSYYRSQHDNQSWLATLAAILDTCALLLTRVRPDDSYQAQLTFAMARHAAVDLALVLKITPREPEQDRLPVDHLQRWTQALAQAGVVQRDGEAADAALTELRRTYEPFLSGLAGRLLLALPPIIAEHPAADNWQRSAWMQPAPGIGSLPAASPEDEHFR